MAIMVAGGLTFAIPGAEPAFAEVITTNPHLYVSAEGQSPDNMFGEGNIIEVIIRDDTIGDTDKSAVEPEVTVNGADLRMLQTANGDWRAYFADASAIGDIDKAAPECPPDPDIVCIALVQIGQLDYGEYCSADTAAAMSGLDLSGSSGVYFPPAPYADPTCDADAPRSGHPLIREAPGLTEHASGKLGQLGLASGDLWPFIQVFDLASADGADIEYNKGGSRETVTLVSEDPPTDVSLDREKYPRGASVHITIDDYAMNIDPTDEDVWTLATGHDNTAAYYNLFDEGGELLNYGQDLVNYQDVTPDLDVLVIARNVQQYGAPLIDCRTTPDFGILGDGSDFLVSNEGGACVVAGRAPTVAVFAPDNLVLNFVEDGPNNNKFVNWAEDRLSNLVVRDDAARSDSFGVSYGPSGFARGAVGHFSGEISLDAPDSDWNASERIDITLTDGDNNANPLAADDLSVADPGSLVIPSIRMGSPITLASAQGPVEWNDLYDGILDTTPPTITPNVSIPTPPNAPYVDPGATCTDGVDPNPVLTVHNPVDDRVPGTYAVTYTCTDSSGNVATATRTVVIVAGQDGTMPTITLNGQPTVSVPKGGTYTDAGATCTDDVDPNPVLTVHNPVDATRQGTYAVTYTCTDSSGNVATATRTVIVGDSPLSLDAVTAGDWDDGALALRVTGKTTLPGVMLESSTSITGLPVRVAAEFGTGNIDQTVTIEDISVHGDTTFYLTASGGVQSNTVTKNIPNALGLTSVTVADVDLGPYWDEGVLTLQVNGTVGVSTVSLVTSDDVIVAADLDDITNETSGVIDGTITTDNISLAGKSVQFQLSSGGVSSSGTAGATDVPAALRLESVGLPDDGWSSNTLSLTVVGDENVTGSTVNLITRAADGNYVAVGEPINGIASGSQTVTLGDIRVSGSTDFMLNFTDANGNNTRSNSETVEIPPILGLAAVKAPDAQARNWAWTSAGLTLNVTGYSNTTANPTLTIDGSDISEVAITEGGASAILTDTSYAGDRVQFALTFTGDGPDNTADTEDDQTVTSTLLRPVQIPAIGLSLDRVTLGVWNASSDTDSLPLTITGNVGAFGNEAVSLIAVNDNVSGNIEISTAITNDTNGAIDNTDLAITNSDVVGMTNFTLRVGSLTSNVFTVDVPPITAVESIVATSGWSAATGAAATLPLRITGYADVSNGTNAVTFTANVGASAAGTNMLTVAADDVEYSATTGAFTATGTLGANDAAAMSNEVISFYSTVSGTTSAAYNATVPSALILDDLTIPNSWNALGKLPITAAGHSFVLATDGTHSHNNVVLAMYESMDAANEGSLDLAPFPRLNVGATKNADGSFSITGSPSLDNAALSGQMVYFRLEASNAAGDTVVSDMYNIRIPAAGSGNSVDTTPKPASFSHSSGFPPITKAVISSMDSDVPAIHHVLKEIVPHAQDRIAHTFESEVEAFSDRLRLAEPATEDLNIMGTSKLVINNWEAPVFMDGVATLFNWNFDSLASHGADITGIFLANGTHKVQLAEGPSGLKDITGMQADLAALGGADRHLVITLSGYVPHLREDIVLVADFFTFGQNEDDGRVNDAIYRIELEESGINSSDYRGTIEYARISEMDTGDPAAYASLRPTSDQISIIVHEDVTDEYSARINYLDLDADGAPTVVTVLLPPFEEAPALGEGVTVTFRGDPYSGSVGQRVQISAYLANGQASAQGFTYIVQILDADGDTVTVSWITSTAGAGQVLSLSTPWMPTEAGTYSATAFTWEPTDRQDAQALIFAILTQGAAFVWDSPGNPAALLPPVTTPITVR